MDEGEKFCGWSMLGFCSRGNGDVGLLVPIPYLRWVQTN
jgi:hypothetical protein